MTRVTMVVCDLCKTSFRESNMTVTMTIRRGFSGDPQEMDLCEDCFQGLQEWIGKRKEKGMGKG